MRVLLLTLAIALSGCAVQYDGTSTHSTTCTQHANGESFPCGELPEYTPVHIDESLEMEPTGFSWTMWLFSVGPNATSSIKVVLEGAAGPLVLHAGDPCIRLEGPTSHRSGQCNPGQSVGIGADSAILDPTLLDLDQLAWGDYELHVDHGPGVGTIHVNVDVDY